MAHNVPIRSNSLTVGAHLFHYSAVTMNSVPDRGHHHLHPEDHHDSGAVKFCDRCATPLERRAVEGKNLPVCPRCGFVVYADPKLAAGAIIERHGRVLLLRRAIHPARGRWTFPGGYVDRGEPVPDAAAREAYEETGVRIAVGALLGVYSARGNPVVLIVYRARLAAGRPRPGPEAQELRWVTAAQIPWPELAFPSTAAALADWSGAPPPTPPAG